MLAKLFPRVHCKYSSLPILGPILGGFATWLFDQGFTRVPVRRQVRATQRIERSLWTRGFRNLSEVTYSQLNTCAPARASNDPTLFCAVRSLGRYLDEQGLLLPEIEIQSKTEILATCYEDYLSDVRGLAPQTISQHGSTARQFLGHVRYDQELSRLSQLTVVDVETFVRITGDRLNRATLQHVVARLRMFLRFLVSRGEIKPGFDIQIDTPRVYRDELLPRSIPWKTVREFLVSIDRGSKCGMRDYAIFLLITTYGLRSSDIVSLTLDDIEWRAGRIRVMQSQTRVPLFLPLTDEVGSCLIQYLRQARPSSKFRELFLRARAPSGVLKPTAVSHAFRVWARRSRLDIPLTGAHCLRHSYAIHLLRQGISLKTIGDLLGHRSPESTCVYLRLAVEDLRDVALELPKAHAVHSSEEVMA